MTYTYLLCDDGGVSNTEAEFIIPIGTKFKHDFGVYKVERWIDDDGNDRQAFGEITQVVCERIKK